jgi:enoyl-CoA hydratase
VSDRSSRIEARKIGAVLNIELSRPEKLNAMDEAMTEEFFATVKSGVSDRSVRVIVLSGAGRAFCAGADISPAAISAMAQGPEGANRERTIMNAARDMGRTRARVSRWLELKNSPKPMIARVHGYCLGIANEIAGCCDIVVCGESAKFGMPEAREFALPPTLGFWPLRIGMAATKRLLWTGQLVVGQEAVRLGLADEVWRDEDLPGRAQDLAERIAEVPSDRLAVIKQAVNAWAEVFGVEEAANRGAEYHAIYHQVSSFAERFLGSE